MKNLFLKFLFPVYAYLSYANTFAVAPEVNCGALPGCGDTGTGVGETEVYNIIGNLIRTAIEYISVIAVIAVMFGGILYLLSGGDEEKTKKAKNVIIWALVGVLISVFAWSIIGIINTFTI
ncbi:pilin [Candidatus Gracilibacteria bacterium]|nr:pilin [Candidatus Gracilibacteria bacterium]